MTLVRPVILLEKLELPEPLFVLEFAVVGPGEVLQQTPFAVIAERQSPDNVPPETALIDVIDVIDDVVTVGNAVPLVNVTSAPYDVPAALVT